MQDAHRIISALNLRKAVGHKRDGHKIALAIESGGMAGVVTGAQLTAIHDLGLTGCFDVIYANSAGAAGAAYLLAETPALGTSIYFEDLAGKGFLSPRRMFAYALRHWRRQAQIDPPGMNLAYMLDIMTGARRGNKKLDINKVFASPVPLKIVVTDLDERRGKAVGDFASPGELLHMLHASCLVPGVAGQAVVGKDGHRLVDGKVSYNSPVQLALDDGYDMVLVLSSRPEDTRLKHRGLAALADMAIVESIRLVARDRNEARALARFARKNARRNHREVEAARHHPGVKFLGLPPRHRRLKPTCTNARVLRRCAVTAYRHAVRTLSGHAVMPVVPEIWMKTKAG